MPESHTALTITPNKILSRYFPPPIPCDENVAISGMHKLKNRECDKNVAISGILCGKEKCLHPHDMKSIVKYMWSDPPTYT